MAAADTCGYCGRDHEGWCHKRHTDALAELAMFKTIAAKFAYMLTNDEKDAADLLAGAIDREKA